MADERMGLLELLRKAGAEGDVDVLREGRRSTTSRSFTIPLQPP